MTEAEFKREIGALEARAARHRRAIKQTMRPQARADLVVKAQSADRAVDRLKLRYELDNLAMLADGA